MGNGRSCLVCGATAPKGIGNVLRETVNRPPAPQFLGRYSPPATGLATCLRVFEVSECRIAALKGGGSYLGVKHVPRLNTGFVTLGGGLYPIALQILGVCQALNPTRTQ